MIYFFDQNIYVSDQSVKQAPNSILKKPSLAVSSVAVLAEIPLRSPQKLFIFIIKKIICWFEVSKNIII